MRASCAHITTQRADHAAIATKPTPQPSENCGCGLDALGLGIFVVAMQRLVPQPFAGRS
jgi:hypothetical protein